MTVPRCRAGFCRSIRSSTRFPSSWPKPHQGRGRLRRESFLIDNIRVEKAHAEHWLWMGEGFGIAGKTCSTWRRGTSRCCVTCSRSPTGSGTSTPRAPWPRRWRPPASPSKGITGDLARKVASGFESYRTDPGVDMGPKTYRWMREHARYDDEHPKIALEVVKRYATTERVHTKVMLAAKRSLQLLRSGPAHLLPGLFGHRRPDRRAERPPRAGIVARSNG